MATRLHDFTGDVSDERLWQIARESARYDLLNDQVMAQNYIAAARMLLLPAIAEVEENGDRLSQDLRVLQENLAEAVAWLSLEQACVAPPISYLPADNWRDS
ncbi:hypothetical protein KOR34_02160 [Posidoniimonas corsicana]|uniref:Uncharacterized protein n=1 Tax=Posidoniimonas corsicana TaxID=1938618 RepID=A0A5C5V9P4_9BACT|nr:hypothetical protein [Posidoniimonas corsicana]TWT35326.1 hypothetical protein KOR34_02160 [Posidoniimonas corsicana]